MESEKQLIADISKFLAELIVLAPDEIRPNDTLSSLGVDSAAVIALSVHIQESYGVLLESEDFTRVQTVSQIAETIRDRSKSSSEGAQ